MKYNPHYYEGKKDETSLDGWEIDKQGKRFRRLGDCIEYAPEFSFPQVRTDKAKEEAERREAQEREARRHTGKQCPFKNGLNTECLTECALYGNTACALSMKETPPGKDTKNTTCPIYGKPCGENCALYFTGCGLIKIVKGLKAGKEH